MSSGSDSFISISECPIKSGERFLSLGISKETHSRYTMNFIEKNKILSVTDKGKKDILLDHISVILK